MTSNCAGANYPTVGFSRNGANSLGWELSQDTVATVVEARISRDRECVNTKADGLERRMDGTIDTPVLVLGNDSTPNGPLCSVSGTQQRNSTFRQVPIGETLQYFPPVAGPISDHADALRGVAKAGTEEWEIYEMGSYFVNIAHLILVCAMLGFAGARGNPVDAPDKIIGAFRHPRDENDLEAIDNLYRLTVIGMYINECDIRKDVMPALMSRVGRIPSECFLRFTDGNVLDVITSLGVLRTLLEPSSELYVELPDEVIPVPAEPFVSRRRKAIAKKQAAETSPVVLPVTNFYRAMPEYVNICLAKPSGGASNAKKTACDKKYGVKDDARILANEEGDRILGLVVKPAFFSAPKDSNKLTKAKIDSFAKSAILAQARLLKTAEKLPEKMVAGALGTSILETMLDDVAYAAFLSECTAANSPRDKIYSFLCFANKAWRSEKLKTQIALFFRDMVLDATAFEDHLAGVSDPAVRAAQTAAMESLRALLPGYKFCSSTVVASKTSTSVAVKAPPVCEVLEDGFM